ncbi:hypothetical protein ACVI1J_008973 [Bradyrhizobium diazoefficiens]
MSNSQPPLGQRFSHVYLQRDELLQDSARARRRLAAWLGSSSDAQDLGEFLVAELGIDLVYQYGWDWVASLAKLDTPDFLDSITLAFRHFTLKKRGGMRDPSSNEKFLEVCRRIFAEEALSYTIDDAGGVHFKVDAEFATSTNAAIAAIGGPR